MRHPHSIAKRGDDFPHRIGMTRALLCLLLLLALSSCARLEHRSRQDGFQSTIQSYIAMLRWNLVDAARFHMGEDLRPISVKDPGKYTDYRVTSTNIAWMAMDNTMTEATVRIEVQWTRRSTEVVQTKQIEQVWWYDTETRRWFNKSPFPDL